MSARSRLLRCYPPAWRARYGEDVASYLDAAYPDTLPLRAAVSLVAGGLRERAHSANLVGSAGSSADRVRDGALTVLAAWAVFVVSGSSFAKISEHFDAALTSGTRAAPDLAYVVVQAIAALTGLVVVAGVALALPATFRLLSSGGWPLMRRHVVRASAATAITVGMTVAISEWAHHLTQTQRNGGSVAYAVAFLAWGGVVAMTVTLWTVATIATARHLTLSRRVLLAEAALAAAATVGMLAIMGSAAVWWAAMAVSAPSFFRGGAFGPASPWSPQLAATLALMLAAFTLAAVGVLRIVRALPRGPQAAHLQAGR